LSQLSLRSIIGLRVFSISLWYRTVMVVILHCHCVLYNNGQQKPIYPSVCPPLAVGELSRTNGSRGILIIVATCQILPSDRQPQLHWKFELTWLHYPIYLRCFMGGHCYIFSLDLHRSHCAVMLWLDKP